MQPDTGWSTGQRALLRFLEQQGVLTGEPAAPETGRPTNGDLFAAFADAIDQQALVDLVSQALRIATVDLEGFTAMPELIALIPVDVARRGEVVPIAQHNGTLEVVTANPLDLETVKSVEFTTGLRVRTKIARRTDVCRAVSEAYGVELDAGPSVPETTAADAPPHATPVEAEPVEDAPVVEAHPLGDVAPEEPVADDASAEPLVTAWRPVSASAPMDEGSDVEAADDGSAGEVGVWSFEEPAADEEPDPSTQVADADGVEPDADLEAAVEAAYEAVGEPAAHSEESGASDAWEPIGEIADGADAGAAADEADPDGGGAVAWTSVEDDQAADFEHSVDDDVRELGRYDDVRLDDPEGSDAGDDLAVAPAAQIDTATDVEAELDPDVDVEIVACDGSTAVAEPEPAEPESREEPTVDPAPSTSTDVAVSTALDRPGVLVVSRELFRRVAVRDAIEAEAVAACVLSMRDEVEARAALALGGVAAIVVERTALATDGRPLWELLRELATDGVVLGGVPTASEVVVLDHDADMTEVATRVRALLEESSDD